MSTTRYIGRCMSKKCGCVLAVEMDSSLFSKLQSYGNYWSGNMLVSDPRPPRMVIDRAREERAAADQIGWCESAKTYRRVYRIKGTYVATVPCDARCTGAKGPNCDCSCGGKNHGAGHVMKLKQVEEAITIGAKS